MPDRDQSVHSDEKRIDEVADRGGTDRIVTVAELRRRLATMSLGASAGGAGWNSEVLPVPEPIAELLPRRGLTPGGVVTVSGAMTLPVALLAAATASGATAALVGLPQLNLAMAADLGADLDRIAVIGPASVERDVSAGGGVHGGVRSEGGGPDSAGLNGRDRQWDRLEVAGVLLDGIDLVLVGVEHVTPSRARVLAGRARRQGVTLLAVGPPAAWPGAGVRMHAQVAGYRHLPLRRNGYGRIGGLQVDIRAVGRGISPRGIRCELVAPGIGEEGSLRLVGVEPRGGRTAAPNRLRVAN